MANVFVPCGGITIDVPPNSPVFKVGGKCESEVSP